jgi:hypothetical protein
LNPETVSQDHGPDEEPDIDQPLVKTLEQARDPIETLEDAVHLHDSNEQIQPNFQQPPEQINAKVIDQGATPLCVLVPNLNSLHHRLVESPMKALLPSTLTSFTLTRSHGP